MKHCIEVLIGIAFLFFVGCSTKGGWEMDPKLERSINKAYSNPHFDNGTMHYKGISPISANQN